MEWEPYDKFISRMYREHDAMEEASVQEVDNDFPEIEDTISVDLDLDEHLTLHSNSPVFEKEYPSDETTDSITLVVPFDGDDGYKPEGKKYDQGKPDYSLVPYASLDEVVKVLTHGANKYGRFNWELVEAHRYEAATMRHFSAYMQGEKLDPESDIHHLAHAITSLLFMLEFELKKER
jgi:hypothetical protein